MRATSTEPGVATTAERLRVNRLLEQPRRQFKNIFIGQRQGNTVSGLWQDTAGSQTQNSGRLTFKVVNGSRLVKSLGNSNWPGSTRPDHFIKDPKQPPL